MPALFCKVFTWGEEIQVLPVPLRSVGLSYGTLSLGKPNRPSLISYHWNSARGRCRGVELVVGARLTVLDGLHEL